MVGSEKFADQKRPENSDPVPTRPDHKDPQRNIIVLDPQHFSLQNICPCSDLVDRIFPVVLTRASEGLFYYLMFFQRRPGLL